MFSTFAISKLLPFKSNYLEVAGYKMHYLDEGSGPIVVALHGNPTWCFYYRNLITELRQHFRIIVPDYIGCGLSDHPEDKHFRAIHRIEQLDEFLSKLGINKLSLIMHDWGGPIGTGWAVRNISKVERLVFLNTTLTETDALPRVIKMAAKGWIGRYITKYSMRFLKLTTDFGVVHKLSKEIKQGYYYPYRSSKRRTAICDFVSDIPFDSSYPSYGDLMDMAGRLADLRSVPVKIIWGLKDPCFHREMLNKVAKHFPQAEVVEIPEASHLVLEDAPQIVCPAVKSFLLDPAPRSGTAVSNMAPSYELQPNRFFKSFSEHAQKSPSADAAIVPWFFGEMVTYNHISFRDLQLLVNKYQRGLAELGLQRGDKVIMLVSPGVDFLALSYAVMGRGAIPVFLDPGMGKENLLNSIEHVKPAAFIGSPKAQVLRWLKRSLFAGIKFHLTASEWFYTGGPTLSYLKKFSSFPPDPVQGTGVALIAFTSGATGVPKGVIYTDEMVDAQLQIFKDSFGIQPLNKDLPLLPIFSLFNLALGVCSVFPPVDPSKPLELSPSKIVKIINDLNVDYSFGSPTLWRKIGEYCLRSTDKLPSIRTILMAGAPVPPETVVLVKNYLPNGEVYTPYGATEALPVTFVSGEDILTHQSVPALTGELGTFVGRAVSGLEVKIISESDERLSETVSLPPLQIGEIVVRGKNVSSEYLDLPRSNELSKIPTSSGLWHRMGDMGYLDKIGNLYFCGRKSHIVKWQGKVFYSIPVERVFNQHPKVRRSALIALARSSGIGIAIEPYPQHMPSSTDERDKFIEELLQLGAANPLTASLANIFFFPSFPVDSRHNAKIFRDKLGEMASREGYEHERAA